MLLSVNINEKSFGSNILYKNVAFEVQKDEKIGLIGRNGTGKSTLLNVISGDDKDFQGEIKIRKGAVVVVSRQEHHEFDSLTVLEYIQGDLPKYSELVHIIDTYPDTMGESQRKIQEFSDALVAFEELGYYQLEEEIKHAFSIYQLDDSVLHRTLGSLSGGQKRLVELIKVIRSRGNIALIDEPTNHMDYVAKESFIKWLKGAKESALVITHDRDVLAQVDRIIEIRDGISLSFKGNYEAYLKVNKTNVTSEVTEYDLVQRRIKNLEEDVIRFQRMKERANHPGTIKRFKFLEQKTRAELVELKSAERPSFWIDQDSTVEMNSKLVKAYDKYKAKNIKVTTKQTDSATAGSLLISVSDLSLGYGDKPLFEGITFSLHEGGRLRLHGRNGSGKSTIVKAILSQVKGTSLIPKSFSGYIDSVKGIKLGVYEQEISERYLPLTLNGAVEQILRDKGLPISEQKVKQLLSDYLFNPNADGEQIVQKLSGGQKARLHLIDMLVDEPQVLILDEPTNHLDLPSIEELENALKKYKGAILYISHDSYFSNKLDGETVIVARV